MDAAQTAAAYSAQQTALAQKIAAELAALWQGMDPADLDASWAAVANRAYALTAGGQILAASTADTYLDEVLRVQGIDPATDDAVRPAAFGQAASDGRPLETLLDEPVIRTKTAIAQGASTAQALNAGLALLDLIARTQIADAERGAVGAGLTARPNAGGYVRMLSPPSCSRCAILAGQFYKWNRGFARHPRCDCRHIPTSEALSDDLRVNPKAYFDSLSQREQERLFTKAGAEAIRDGADMNQVVNARRGIYTAGGRRYTKISTGKRGLYGSYDISPDGSIRQLPRGQRGKKPPRLTTEQIYRDAAGDRDKAIELLRSNGYLTGKPTVRAATVPKVPTFAERSAAAATGERALKAAPLGLNRTTAVAKMSGDERDLLRQYKGTAYDNVNAALRRELGRLPGTFGFDYYREITGAIDAVMARSALTGDVLLLRGIQSGRAVFGAAWDTVLTGAQWTEYGYLSTTTAQSVAQQFARDGGATMRIVATRGTRAIELSGADYEAELLLQRNLRLRVVSDTGPGPDRVIEVEILR